MTARRADRADAPVVAALLAAFNAEFDTWAPPTDVLERRFATLLDRDDALIVLSESPDPVGFALVTFRPSPYYDGPVASLDELYVAPRWRGHGLGSELMVVLLRVAAERGCGEVQINVDEGDCDTRRFYESHGFVNHEPGSAERMLCYLREL